MPFFLPLWCHWRRALSGKADKSVRAPYDVARMRGSSRGCVTTPCGGGTTSCACEMRRARERRFRAELTRLRARAKCVVRVRGDSVRKGRDSVRRGDDFVRMRIWDGRTGLRRRNGRNSHPRNYQVACINFGGMIALPSGTQIGESVRECDSQPISTPP